MCGLCGMLGIVHWTETSAHPEAFTGAGRRTIRAERMHRAAVVNALLAPARLRVADFAAQGYVLTSPTGRSEIVDDVGAVWAAAERVRGQPVDPLDESWIAAMEEAAR